MTKYYKNHDGHIISKHKIGRRDLDQFRYLDLHITILIFSSSLFFTIYLSSTFMAAISKSCNWFASRVKYLGLSIFHKINLNECTPLIKKCMTKLEYRYRFDETYIGISISISLNWLGLKCVFRWGQIFNLKRTLFIKLFHPSQFEILYIISLFFTHFCWKILLNILCIFFAVKGCCKKTHCFDIWLFSSELVQTG